MHGNINLSEAIYTRVHLCHARVICSKSSLVYCATGSQNRPGKVYIFMNGFLITLSRHKQLLVGCYLGHQAVYIVQCNG